MLHENKTSAACDTSETWSSTAAASLRTLPTEWAIVGVSSLGHALCHMGELTIVGALVAIRQQFDLDPHIVTSLPYLGYVLLGLGAIPAGLAVDRFGADSLLRWYYWALALAAGLVTVANSAWMLFIALTFLGAVLSVYHPAGTALISVGLRRREWAMGVNGVAGSIGVSLGPLLGGLWASFGYWQGAFATIAIISLLGGFWMRRISYQVLGHQSSIRNVVADRSIVISDRRFPWLAILLLYLCMMLGGLNYRTFVTALPIYVTGDASQAAALAKGGIFSFAVLLAGTIGQYSSGALAQRFGAMSIYRLAIFLMAPLSACLASTDYSTLSIPLAGVLAITLFAQQPVENSLLAESTQAGRRGLSYGAKFALTFGIGAIGAPLVGLIWHYTSQPRVSFWLLVISAATMSVALFWYHYLNKRTASLRRDSAAIGQS